MNPPNPPAPRWFTGLFSTERVRIAEYPKIVDEERFFSVMMADPEKRVRLAAVRRLTDQALLRQAAREDLKEDVRAEAAARLTEQEVLYDLLFRDPSEKVRLAAGGALKDETLCFRAAMLHPLPAVRTAAVGRIRDQRLLARIAAKSANRETCLEAAAALSDPDLARELVLSMPPDREDFASPRAYLIHAVTDQALLADLALNDPDVKARRAAASRLTDQALLMKIIEDETEYDGVRAAAAGQITDQDLLRKLADAYNHKYAPYDIGEEALRHIGDQEYLKSAAENYGMMFCLRAAAAEHVTDQEILFGWAMEASGDTVHDIGLARIAVLRLNEPEYLAKAAVARADSGDLAERAIERLEDDRWLLWVIQELGKREDALGDWWVRSLRCAAAYKVRDAGLLVEPALSECNDEYDFPESLEQACVQSIADSPEAMYEYGRRFTNPDAWSCAEEMTVSRRGLEGFLENPGLKESRKEAVREKLSLLDRLGEIGLRE